jgi:hypothetical protein
MDEKNRLGDKLRDKGKAAEDLFIAQQEQERLARIKAKSATGTVGSGACPRDGEKLVQRSEHTVTIDVCPACNGIWLDNGELETILKNEEEPGVTRWLRGALGR